MDLTDAIALIKHKNPAEPRPATWADLGCGNGLFTYALAHQLPVHSVIYAIDKDTIGLKTLPNPNQVLIQQQQLDFIADPLPFSGLDGILMANSLHYVQDKAACITKLSQYLNQRGYFLLVEYDTNIPNPWVPYPIRYASLPDLFGPLGYPLVGKLQEKPSLFGRANLYSALIRK